jgi:2-keto-4-pentenoate hydratase/2-oxohepta-3-ene-1,7-dioic acid hydratase in catechol pathway
LRIVRYTPDRASEDQAPRLGLMLGDDRIGDLRRAHERMLAGAGDRGAAEIAALRFPGNVAAHLAGGEVAHQALLETAAYLSGDDTGAGGGHALVRKLDQCRLLAPVKPWKIIAVGRNYGSHDKEMSQSGSGFPKAVPSAWIKSNSALTGPFDDIHKPAATDALDYETELTLVISKHCKNVAEADAMDVIAGYMIGIDVTARDVVRLERAEGNQLMGKMFDSFAPMGPWMITADEVPDPMNLAIQTRVNGEIRQDGSTAGMIWDIPKLISYVSQMSLEPGDLIMTGTPSGVAAGHKVEGENWFMQAGDVLESEIAGIGVLRNKIVDAPGEVQWDWERSRAGEKA